MNLSNRHAVVTGGGSGVGQATAVALAEAGAAVTVIGRRVEALVETAAQHEAITGYGADVTDRESLEEALTSARAGAGPIDIMIASAGISNSAPFHRLAVEDLDQLMQVNVYGVFHAFQIAYNDLRNRDWGRLIAVASTAGMTGYPYVSHYCASKHAVVGLVRSLAQEAGRTGTTVNAVCPSYVDTPMTERTIQNIVDQTGMSEADALAALTASNPQGRLISPAEVAGSILYLCSDAAASVNGRALAIDGGEL